MLTEQTPSEGRSKTKIRDLTWCSGTLREGFHMRFEVPDAHASEDAWSGTHATRCEHVRSEFVAPFGERNKAFLEILPSVMTPK
jgi:hypothetical protein